MSKVTEAMLLQEVLKVREEFDKTTKLMEDLSKRFEEVEELMAATARETRASVNEIRELRQSKSPRKTER